MIENQQILVKRSKIHIILNYHIMQWKTFSQQHLIKLLSKDMNMTSYNFCIVSIIIFI